MKVDLTKKDSHNARAPAKDGRSFFGVRDMTTGDPVGGIVRFSVPLLIGNFAQQLYNTADSIIVGNYIGDPS